MEEFKKDLEILLSRYSDLPEFTLKIQPRIVITPVTLVPTSYPPIAFPGITNGVGGIGGILGPITNIPKNVVINDVTSLEASITKKKIDELSKSGQFEQSK